MSTRIDKSWVVLESIENAEHDRCVDLFRRPDGSFGFEVFRRDVEDAGLWTAVAYHSGAAYALEGGGLSGCRRAVSWLAERSRPARREPMDGGQRGASVKANGIEIEYETAGNKSDPALLLVMGLGAQLTIWPDAFFQGLAQAGLLRHPLRQSRHRPLDRLRLVGRGQHRRRAAEG